MRTPPGNEREGDVKNRGARTVMIVLCSLLAAVISYSVFFLMPPVAVQHDEPVLSPRHQELLDKEVLTVEEAAELVRLATLPTPVDPREGHAILRKNALVFSWVPWFVFAFMYPRLSYKELLLWVPALLLFWLMGLFVMIELGVFVVAGAIGIGVRQSLYKS